MLCVISLQRPLKHKAATSKDSKDYFERYRSQSLVGEDSLPMPQEDLISHLREIAEEGPEPETFTESTFYIVVSFVFLAEIRQRIRFADFAYLIIPVPMNIPCLLPRASRQNSMRTNDDDDQDFESSFSQDSEDANEGDTSNADSSDYQKVLRLLEEGDKVNSAMAYSVHQVVTLGVSHSLTHIWV